jgi:hypothetical protein
MNKVLSLSYPVVFKNASILLNRKLAKLAQTPGSTL